MKKLAVFTFILSYCIVSCFASSAIVATPPPSEHQFLSIGYNQDHLLYIQVKGADLSLNGNILPAFKVLEDKTYPASKGSYQKIVSAGLSADQAIPYSVTNHRSDILKESMLETNYLPFDLDFYFDVWTAKFENVIQNTQGLNHITVGPIYSKEQKMELALGKSVLPEQYFFVYSFFLENEKQVKAFIINPNETSFTEIKPETLQEKAVLPSEL